MPREPRTEHILIEQARQGDPSAWRTLYESTCDRLFAFLCYQIRDRDEARDILQETYLQAFRRLSTFRGEAPFEVWLRSIALGRSIDWKRVILRRIKRSTALEESSGQVQADHANVRFDSEDRAMSLALAKLSHHQRAALLLREWEGRSFQEVGVLLGCAEGTARVHHARARERMRAALGRRTGHLTEAEWGGQES